MGLGESLCSSVTSYPAHSRLLLRLRGTQGLTLGAQSPFRRAAAKSMLPCLAFPACALEASEAPWLPDRSKHLCVRHTQCL